MIELYLEDTQYPFTGIKHERDVARALIMDERGNFAIHRLAGKDWIGDRNYYETPGGGVDEGETPEIAVVRECMEEVGYKVEVLEEIAIVHDYYNVIGRKNHNHYYLCKLSSDYIGKHFVSKGDILIAETLFLPLDEVISRYESQPDTMLAKLVKDRELPVWRHLKDILEKKYNF